MSEFGLFTTLFSSVALLVIAVLILMPLFTKRGSLATGSGFFALLCVSAAIWLAANILSDVDISNSLFWVRVSFVSITITLYSFLMFVNRFPEPRFVRPLETAVHTVIASVMLILILTPWFIPRVEFENSIATVIPGTLYVVFFPYVAYALLLAIWRLSRVGKMRPLHRTQARLILLGIGITAGIATITNLILPFILGTNDLYWMASVGALALVATSAYSIIKQHLFDIRTAFTRTLAYVGSIVVIGTLLGLIVAQIMSRIHMTTANLQVTMTIAAIAVAIVYPPIKTLFDALTEKIFFRKTYTVQRAINEMTEVFSRATSLEHLLSRTATELRRFTGSESAIVILQPHTIERKVSRSARKGFSFASEETINRLIAELPKRHKLIVFDELDVKDEGIRRAMEGANIALASQVLAPNGLIGYIMLGRKQNGHLYTQRDVELIDTVSDEFAIAIQSMLRLQEILELNAGLQARIESATADLRMTNKKLKQLDQTKDEFISLTSHQLRTPLTTIKGYISMLLDGDAGELSSSQRKLLEEAFNSSQRMVHLISDFLNISRIQTGKFEVELSETNLADVLDEEIDQLRASAVSRQINLLYDKPTNFPVMSVDEGKIRQVMMNFIDNALYYSPAQTDVHVVLSYSGKVVEFKVIDHGIGVPAAEQHKLFNKFVRASNAKKQRPDGTGIGLFMAKKIVVLHDGAIIFESKEGQGSTFGFRLNR